MKEFCVLLPHLLNEKGHHYIYNRSAQVAIESIGLKFCAYISDRCCISSLGPEWKIVFHKKSGKFGRYVSVIFRFFRYCRLLREEALPRIYFVEDFANLELSLVTISVLFFMRRSDSLWLLHRFLPSRYRYNGSIISCCLRLLRWRLRHRFVEWTDSAVIEEDFKKQTAHRIRILPIPHAPVHSTPFKSKSLQADPSIRLWWPGEPRDSKGLLEIQGLLCLSRVPLQTFEIVAASTAPLPTPLSKCLQLRLVEPILTRSQYEVLLKESSGILLPYDPIAYRENTSGVLVEAILAGKEPFVRAGSWLARELQRYGLDELILDWSDPDLLFRILELLRDDRIKSKLSFMQESYAQFHSISSFARNMQQCLA